MTHNKVTDAILMWTDIGEGDLETMLGRAPWTATGNPDEMVIDGGFYK